jgi:molybdopterin-synthase adenylyltransferase
MKLELSPGKLRAAAVNVIDMGGGVVIKRGRVEIKVAGEEAGKVVCMVLNAAREGTTREHILEMFAPPEHPAITGLVDHLIGRNILMSEDGASSPPATESQLDIFYWHFGTQTKDIRRRLNSKRIRIFGVNHISLRLAAGLRTSGADGLELFDLPLLRNEALFTDAGELKEDLRRDSSFTLRPFSGDLNPESLDCLIVTSDRGCTEQLRAWNEFCVLHRIQYYPVMLQDLVGYIGPMVLPGESPCFECLRSRQNAHMMDFGSRRAVEAAFIEEQTVGGFHPSMASILGDIAALEITKHFGLGNNLGKVGTVIEVNLLAPEMKARRILKLPRCPVCSRLNRTPSVALTKSILMGNGEE